MPSYNFILCFWSSIHNFASKLNSFNLLKKEKNCVQRKEASFFKFSFFLKFALTVSHGVGPSFLSL